MFITFQANCVWHVQVCGLCAKTTTKRKKPGWEWPWLWLKMFAPTRKQEMEIVGKIGISKFDKLRRKAKRSNETIGI